MTAQELAAAWRAVADRIEHPGTRLAIRACADDVDRLLGGDSDGEAQ